MFCKKPERTYTTNTGLKLVIIPRPSLLGVILDGDGQPESVKYPDYRYYTPLSYKTYSTLKGINQEDYDSIKPDLVLYELKDGTLLQADPELFVDSEMSTHNATSDGKACYIHNVSKLVLAQMPEIEQVPVYDLSEY